MARDAAADEADVTQPREEIDGAEPQHLTIHADSSSPAAATVSDLAGITAAPTMSDVDDPHTQRDDPPTRHESEAGRVDDLHEKIRRQLAESEVRRDDMIGSTVGGRFVIEKKLGAGGMGAVYKARQADLGREVAVKVLLEELTSNDTQARRFTVEALAVSRLKHPNTIQIFDFGKSEQGRLYIAMELLEGETLNDRIRTLRRMPVRMALRILAQVAAALDEAHGKGIIHRDLKPENIFLVRVGEDPDFVKVLDFGVAKLRDGVGDGQGTLTKAGSIFGTPRYMSPEQASARPVDARSDLYSLGIILYEMLAGSPPFDSETPLTLLLAHVNTPVPPLITRDPGLIVPREVEQLVSDLLEKQPAKRPESAAALRDRCLALVASLPDAFDGQVDAATAAELGVAVSDARTIHVTGLVDAPVAAEPAAAVVLEQTPPPRSRTPLIIGLVAGLAAIAGFSVALRPSPPTPASAAAASQATAAAAAPPAPSVVAGPTVIALRLETEPEGARVVVVGADADQPELLGQTPLSLERTVGTQLRVQLMREGFAPMAAELIFDRPRTIQHRLVARAPEPTPPPALPVAANPAAPSDARGPKRAPKPAGKPASPVGTTEAPAAVKPTPKPDPGRIDDLL